MMIEELFTIQAKSRIPGSFDSHNNNLHMLVSWGMPEHKPEQFFPDSSRANELVE